MKRRNSRGIVIAWLAAGFLILTAAGCVSRPDWIEQTLVTVDVTGVWQGTSSTAGRTHYIDLKLQQSGPKVTGEIRLKIMGTGSTIEGPIEGTVNGDKFNFREVRGQLNAELHVNGDEMTGFGTHQYGPGVIALRRQP